MLAAIIMLLSVGSETPPSDAEYSPQVSPAVVARVGAAEDGDTATLIADLEALSQAGDVSATELLGEILSFGLFGIAPDRTKACRYFAVIAEDDPLAAHNLATCHFDGSITGGDLVEARRLYRLASDGGYSQSHCAYGNMLINGQGGPKDVEEGLAMCRKGAEQGEAHAQTDLGGYLLVGKVISRDPEEARRLLTLAADDGHANAAFLLAQIYLKGDGIAANPDIAEQRFRQSYAAGRLDAAWQICLILGRRGYHQDGQNMSLSVAVLEEALWWAKIAAERDPSENQQAKAREMIANLKVLIAAGKAE